jgi:hypothetical protein
VIYFAPGERKNKKRENNPMHSRQVIETMRLAWLERPPRGRLTRRAKQAHDAIIAPMSILVRA